LTLKYIFCTILNRYRKRLSCLSLFLNYNKMKLIKQNLFLNFNIAHFLLI